MSSSVCYFYFGPVIDERQPMCYAVILLWFLIAISLFDMTVVTKENLQNTVSIGQCTGNSSCCKESWWPLPSSVTISPFLLNNKLFINTNSEIAVFVVFRILLLVSHWLSHFCSLCHLACVLVFEIEANT